MPIKHRIQGERQMQINFCFLFGRKKEKEEERNKQTPFSRSFCRQEEEKDEEEGLAEVSSRDFKILQSKR